MVSRTNTLAEEHPHTSPVQLSDQKREALDSLLSHLKSAEERADREGWIPAEEVERRLGIVR